MAARRRKKSKKVNILLCCVIALICSFLVLSWLSESLHFKYIPTLSEIQNFFIEEKHIEGDGDCEVHFIDVGQGDCELIFCGDKVVLIDAGEIDKGEIVSKYLSNHGVKKIDYLIATHPHSDHIGGMKTIVEDFDIDKIIMPKIQYDAVPTTKVYTQLLTAIADKGYKITPAKVNDTYELAKGSKFTILGPVAEYSDLNNMSVVAMFEFGNTHFLFTGDMERKAEKATLLDESINLKADVLKVAHHGGNTSTSKEFYAAVDPEYCVICVGTDNSYGHPSSKVISRINVNNPKVYTTAENGNIIFSIKGGELIIKTEK